MDSAILAQRLDNIHQNMKTYAWDKDNLPKLVAVSKTVDAQTTNLLAQHQQFDIGENRVQTIEQKLPFLSKDFNLHFIGRLQTNKIRYIIENVYLFHSIDRLRLVEELNKQALARGLKKDVLLQVNIAGEEQKAGFEKNDALAFIKKANAYEGLHFKGLMAIMPFMDDELALANYFKQMRALFDHIKELSPLGVEMNILSMGMTHDYKIALAEGSTMVRIGSAIFHE